MTEVAVVIHISHCVDFRLLPLPDALVYIKSVELNLIKGVVCSRVAAM